MAADGAFRYAGRATGRNVPPHATQEALQTAMTTLIIIIIYSVPSLGPRDILVSRHPSQARASPKALEIQLGKVRLELGKLGRFPGWGSGS